MLDRQFINLEIGTLKDKCHRYTQSYTFTSLLTMEIFNKMSEVFLASSISSSQYWKTRLFIFQSFINCNSLDISRQTTKTCVGVRAFCWLTACLSYNYIIQANTTLIPFHKKSIWINMDKAMLQKSFVS